MAMLILYATETGNAEDVAERIGREAARRNYKPLVMSMERYDPRLLSTEGLVIFVVSTTGQGDIPSTMKNFWRALLKKNTAKLNSLHYGVFGLGDSGYQKFNVVAKKLDRRIADLGGNAVIPKGLGDDQHRSGYEGALDPWLSSLWKALHEKFGTGLIEPELGEVERLDPPKFRIKYHTSLVAPFEAFAENLSGVQSTWMEQDRARRMVDMASGSNQLPVPDSTNIGRVPNNPVFAQVRRNVRLTDASHDQDVRHLEFDLGDSNVEYSPGDVVMMIPRQDAKAVHEFCKRCKLDSKSFVSVALADGDLEDKMDPVTIETLVEAVMDISSASPRRYLFEVMMHFAQAEHEKERLQYFASPEGRDDLYNYNQRERRTVLEVLEDFPSVHLPLEWLVQLVPRLRPRYFSISSSLIAHPNEIHTTIAVVQWKTPFKRTRQGLCSTWLSQLKVKTDIVPLWITKGILKLPPPSVPLILVGPGTGCAPFRAFIEERAVLAKTQTVAPVLFFFGCRFRSKDFLYQDQWTSLSHGGILSEQAGGGFFVAFSRDQPQKVYVQHKIQEQAALVWKLIQHGGAIFISGSANKMPEDVAAAFQDVVAAQSGDPSAPALLKQLERLGRYTVEVWS